jgi:putative peptidoglycan lipid II flippase
MVRSFFSTGQKLISRQSSSILSAASIITGASFLSAILGLVRNRLLVGNFFGDEVLTSQLDAYWVAFRIPELVFQLLVIGAMSAAFIPVYSKYKEKSEADANRMAASMLNLVLIVFVVLSVIIYFNAARFNQMITSSNFTPDQVELAASLTKIMLLAQLFFAASNFMTGIIQANQRFLLPALSPLAYNLGIILGIVFLTPYFGIYGPAWGVVLGALLHVAIQLPLALSLGFRPRWIFQFKHPGVKEMLQLIPPRTLAISVDQIELFASVYFTTGLSAGSLTMLNLAQQLMNAPTRIFSVPIGQASLPFLSKEAAKNQIGEFRKTLTQTLNQMLFLAFPAGVLLLVLRIPLVRLAYGAAEFPWSATLLTGKLVAIFALAIFAYGGVHILVRAFYALHNTRTPLYVALFSVVLSIMLMTINSRFIGGGILGVGFSLSVATLTQFSILIGMIQKKYQAIDLGSLGKSQLRIVTASLIMGVSLWIPMRLLDTLVFDTTRTLPLIGLTTTVGLIGLAVYFGLMTLFKAPELAAYKGIFQKLGKWRSILADSDEVLESASQTEEVKPW